MNKINLNLLPAELIRQETETHQKGKVISLSIGLLAVIVALTTATLALRLFQERNLNMVNTGFQQAKDKVASLKDQEGEVILLKQRLSSISSLVNQDSKTVQAYNLINTLFPSTVEISSLSLDKNGTITVSAQVSDTNSLRTLFENLTNSAINQGRINNVQIDSFNRSPSGFYRIDLTVHTL